MASRAVPRHRVGLGRLAARGLTGSSASRPSHPVPPDLVHKSVHNARPWPGRGALLGASMKPAAPDHLDANEAQGGRSGSLVQVNGRRGSDEAGAVRCGCCTLLLHNLCGLGGLLERRPRLGLCPQGLALVGLRCVHRCKDAAGRRLQRRPGQAGESGSRRPAVPLSATGQSGAGCACNR